MSTDQPPVEQPVDQPAAAPPVIDQPSADQPANKPAAEETSPPPAGPAAPPPWVDSLQRHRKRMAEIHSRGLESVARLAQINTLAIFRHSVSQTPQAKENIDAAVQAVEKAIQPDGGPENL